MCEMDYKYCVVVLNVCYNLKDMGYGEIFFRKFWYFVYYMMYIIYYEVKIKFLVNVKISYV